MMCSYLLCHAILTAQARNANGHANMPVRLLDTADLVRYLAEQRTDERTTKFSKQSFSGELAQLTFGPEDSGKSHRWTHYLSRPLSRFRANRRQLSLLLVALSVVGAGVTALLVLTLHQSIEAVVKESHIEWDFVRLDEFTPNTLHIFALGRFESAGVSGLLEATEFDMSVSRGAGGVVGKLQLPEVFIGHAPDNSFSVDQSIILQDKSENLELFSSLRHTTAQLLLRGTGVFRWKKFRTPVRFSPIVTTLQGLGGDNIKYSPRNTFALATSPANDSITFESNITLRNISPLSVRLLHRRQEYCLTMNRQISA